MVEKSASSQWVVLKFGGTSVSTRPNWDNILSIARARRSEGHRVLIVHSAVTGITDRLVELLASPSQVAAEEVLQKIAERHQQLASELGLVAKTSVSSTLADVRKVLQAIDWKRGADDTTRASVLSTGELMATQLGCDFLRAQGLNIDWLDARDMLQAQALKDAHAKATVLSAACDFSPNSQLVQRLTAGAEFALTQGFIARDSEGRTVLLGRGGSDTAAAYLAAKIRARRLEIWTDVPGMFSANPRTTPTARLLKALHYDEALEIATAGAKVLHPRCILPARQYSIPVHVLATNAPAVGHTEISAAASSGAAEVKAVCLKKGVTLIAMESPGMWHQVGFLADAFATFKRHGLSVDQVSTSETSVTVSLDPQANTLEGEMVAKLVEDLSSLCRVQVIGPCASVSLVGHNIRAVLPQLGDALEVFDEQRIYMVSQAANDLNLTFVVDEGQGNRLVEQLHERLIGASRVDEVMGPSWQQLFSDSVASQTTPREPWWQTRRTELLALMSSRDSAYVYDLSVVREKAALLRSCSSVNRLFYAMKANFNSEVLRTIWDAGVGIECVSVGEINRVCETISKVDSQRILFTPNFAAKDEYEFALEMGAWVTVDNLSVAREWKELWRGRKILIRVDPGIGRGHHRHVRTAGAGSKFGIPLEELPSALDCLRAAGAQVCGLHAHSGSGIFNTASWAQTARLLIDCASGLPDVRALNLGGGLGVPERPGGVPLDIKGLDQELQKLHGEVGARFEFWLEPGRFLVAESGVLLARVNQVKTKGVTRYVGVATGMNSLIRPALYGSYHHIVNLSRLDAAATELTQVVGPICESGDTLGHDRFLPQTEVGDVLLISTTGAYGRAMASQYNLREPAPEFCLN